MRIVELGRLFIDWTDKDTDAEALRYLPEGSYELEWEDLIGRRRVVLLAEPGSGKSTELDRQVEFSKSRGRYTFCTTVQNLGAKGWRRAFGEAQLESMDGWRSSDQSAWFFIDSVDEA